MDPIRQKLVTLSLQDFMELGRALCEAELNVGYDKEHKLSGIIAGVERLHSRLVRINNEYHGGKSLGIAELHTQLLEATKPKKTNIYGDKVKTDDPLTTHLRAELEAASEIFFGYSKLHLAKGTADGNAKGEINHEHGLRFHRAADCHVPPAADREVPAPRPPVLSPADALRARGIEPGLETSEGAE